MSRKIAILGGGRIGEALLAGLLSSGWREPSEVVVTSRRDERVAELRELHGAEATTDNLAAVSGAAVVVVAVKPQDIDVLLGEIDEHLTTEQTVVSVAADEQLALAEELLSHLGRVVRVPEEWMDAITAVSGSGPAYFALLAEAMIEAGILLGLSREVSTTLVVQTMFGTAKQLRDQGMHPVELRESVTSPGGTTIAAIRELEQAGVRAASTISPQSSSPTGVFFFQAEDGIRARADDRPASIPRGPVRRARLSRHR